MTQSDYDMETLNAYLDGELPGFRAAALLRAIALDPELARQVSEMKSLKSAVSVAYDDLPCKVPDIDALLADRDRNRWQQRLKSAIKWRLPAAALKPKWTVGAIGAVAVVLVSVVLLGWLSARPTPDMMMAKALTLHDQWVRETGKNDEDGRAQLALFKATNGDIYIPDLSANKLYIAKVTPFGENGVHVGYKGTRDCHISLFIQPTSMLKNLPLAGQEIGTDLTYRWRLNRLDYILLAVGIDPNRLHLIATDIFQAARLGLPFDSKTRLALRLNRRTSLPCAA